MTFQLTRRIFALIVLCTFSTDMQVAQATPKKVRDLVEPGLEQSPAVLNNCGPLPKIGADDLQVHIIDGSHVWLEGLKDRTILWKKRFPLSTEINPPKTTASCEKGGVELYSEAPFMQRMTIQRFFWNGRVLKNIGTATIDPSADALERFLKAIDCGIVEESPDQIMYPCTYICLPAVIKRAHVAALTQYRNGHPEKAAKIMRAGFQGAVTLGGVIGVQLPDGKEKTVEGWTMLFKDPAAYATLRDYLTPLNDYGFFLQKAGKDSEAIPIFEQVIKLDPNRKVAYLNLADSERKLGRKQSSNFFDVRRRRGTVHHHTEIRPAIHGK